MAKLTRNDFMRHFRYYTIKSMADEEMCDAFMQSIGDGAESYNKFLKAVTDKSMIQTMLSYMKYLNDEDLTDFDTEFDNCYKKIILENKVINY